ncbi:MAG: UDP-N-acetylmuramoyl-tripeptide--D-alanyl-D-alanine ligase [Gemmatimonadales bacterium]
MSRWSVEFGGEALGMPLAGPGWSEISTDTRTLGRGALFVALTGERFDGHEHLTAAVTRGASAAVVRRGTVPVSGLALIEVDDTLRAYGALARARRREIAGPVIAITGSNGKTSTKEMVAAVLSTRYRVHATAQNLNNLVGIPQTILGAPEDTEALVIEAGASEPGELARAQEIIEPTAVIITNVAASHLDGFGSVDGILREKLSLADGVALAVVGSEPPALGEGAARLADRVIVVPPPAATVDAEGRATFTIDGRAIALPVRGPHQAHNALLAWMMGKELGLSPDRMATALGRVTLPGGRGELLGQGGLTILNDSYNANPASFFAAIATARAMRSGRRLVFVAGTMKELGADSPRYHREVAAALVALDPELLAVVGDFVPALEPHRARMGERLLTAPDAPALGPLLKDRLRGDELVVLKASRGAALERILPYLGVTPTASH